MSRGKHAAGDGSFGRSASAAALRGAALIFAAVLLGVVLLNATEGSEPFASEPGDRTERTATTVAPDDDDVDGTTTATTAPARDPAEVKVLVANGSGVQGAAGRLTDQLKGVNYNVLAPTNTSERAAQSVVFYAPGFQAEAEALARILSPSPTVAPMPEPLPIDDLKGADVLVVMAEELAATAPDPDAEPGDEGAGDGSDAEG